VADDLPRLEPRPTHAVPSFLPGRPVSAGALTTLAAIAVSGVRGVEPPRMLDRARDVDPRVYPLMVISDQGDYLSCEPWGVSAADALRAGIGGTTRVAKPYLLRRTPFHLKTRASVTYDYREDDGVTLSPDTRTATDAAGRTQEEEIVPRYEPGDLIYATKAAGRTVVTPPAQDPIAIDLLDMNFDGRAWATA
jgi:hypothetical protein